MALFLIVLPQLASGFYALWMGQDINWDLRNYHFYNPYAYLTDRMGHDINVSGSVTYYNPLMHIPFYYAVTAFQPQIVGFLLGFIQGFNFYPLFGIAKIALNSPNKQQTFWTSYGAAVIGMLGAGNLSETGTSFGDNVLSIFVLSAIWIIMSFQSRFSNASLSASWVAVLAGVLCGVTFGAKLPFAVYSLAMCLSFFALAIRFRHRFILSFLFGIGVLIGISLAGGFWMYILWDRYGSPIFPHYNHIFKSPWAAPVCNCDVNFFPQDAVSWIFFPFVFALNPFHVGEVYFQDYRFPILYILLVATFGTWFFRKITRYRIVIEGYSIRFLIAFIIIAFILWLRFFSIYRYLIVCELLTPIIIAACLIYLIRSQKLAVRSIIACFVIMAIALEPGNWGRRGWDTDYFGFKTPQIQSNAIVLLAGYEPMSYLIPSFPEDARFLRIQRYLDNAPSEMDRLMHRIVQDHQGPLYAIYRIQETQAALNTFQGYKVRLEESTCVDITPELEDVPENPYLLCILYKDQQGDFGPASSETILRLE